MQAIEEDLPQPDGPYTATSGRFRSSTASTTILWAALKTPSPTYRSSCRCSLGTQFTCFTGTNVKILTRLSCVPC